MKQETRDIQQEYWTSSSLPHLEMRSTWQSLHVYKSHSHQEFSIGAVTEGGTQTTCLNQKYTVLPGELVCFEPHQVHSCNPRPGIGRSYHMLYLNTDWCLEQLTRLYGQPVTQVHCQQLKIKDSKLFDLFLSLVESIHQEKIADATQVLEELCFNVFSRYCLIHRGSESENELIKYVKFQLLNNFVDPPSLDELAKELNIRKETIVRTFNRHVGISPKAFLNNARIEQAKIKLRAGVDIVDVALQVGFSDQSHFHKTFVNYTCATPKQYRKINF